MASAAEIIALLLDPDDREVALGDLQERGQRGWSGFFAVVDFVVRQQGEYWRNWRPWLAGSVVLPVTLLLLGASFRLSMDFRSLWHGGNIRESLTYEALLTLAWAWTSGFAIGSLARRTSWISLLLCMMPCLFCLLRFREPSLWSPCLLLFLPPGILGAMLGQCRIRMEFLSAAVLALATTGVMLLWRDMPSLNWLLSLPAWYLVLASGKPNLSRRETSHDHI